MPNLRRLRRWTGAIRRCSFRGYQSRPLERIFLHIGVEKTGTTTLQVAMAINRSLLHKHGFAIPTGRRAHPPIISRSRYTRQTRTLYRNCGKSPDSRMVQTIPPFLKIIRHKSLAS